MLTLRPVGPQFQRSITQATFRLGHQRLCTVTTLDLIAFATVLIRPGLRLGQQSGDFLLVEVGASLNGNGLLPAGGSIRGTDLQETVGIDIKCHLNLGHSARGRRNTGQAETTERLVV